VFDELGDGRLVDDPRARRPTRSRRAGSREGGRSRQRRRCPVALDTTLDDELLLEGQLYDRIHEINVLPARRKAQAH
jgi:hypothetical protein